MERRRRRRRAVELAAAALVVVGGGVGGWISSSSSAVPPHRAVHHHLPKTSGEVQAPTISLGPDGVQSSAVVSENHLPGTTAWQITGTPPGTIAGYADTTYAAVGDTVQLYVTTTAPTFEVTAYRIGFYGGTGGREVWQSAAVTGTVQPPCTLTPGINMVSCDNWARSLSVPITAQFVPGDYLLKLVGSGGQQSYVLLTVWDPNSHATYLVMARSLTEQGWNTYGGGYSFYQGRGPCTLGSGSYPPCNRARVVSFDRPYDSGNGATDFLGGEYPLVYFAEEHGLDVTYATDITVNDHPDTLLQHKALLSLSHDETWTTPERQGAEAALSHGVNIAFFSAAAIVRHARLEASPLGPDRQEVDYRDSSEDPLNGKGDPLEVTGNTWSSPPTSWPSSGFVGEVYSGYLYPSSPNAPFVVHQADAWIFKGTGLQDGSAIPGVIASDIDHIDRSAMPEDVEVLGHSPVSLTGAYTNQGTWGGFTYADMTYYTDPKSHGGVFDSGTVNWINTLLPCPAGQGDCPAGLTDQITGNLLWLFGQGPAGLVVPSVANWQTVTPPGS
jgi:hypothetical protein